MGTVSIHLYIVLSGRKYCAYLHDMSVLLQYASPSSRLLHNSTDTLLNKWNQYRITLVSFKMSDMKEANQATAVHELGKFN